MNKVLFSSQSDEWATPKEVFELLDKEFGFTLDAAASDVNHKTDKYFTKEDNGLEKSWGATRCFAIRHIAISEGGLRNLTENLLNRVQQWLCLSLPGLIQSGSTGTYTRDRK